MRSSIAALFLVACGNGGTASDAGTKDATNESSIFAFHLKGQIVDSTTGAPIPFAAIGIGPFQEATDGTGSYDQVEAASVSPVGPFGTYAAAPDSGTSYVLTNDQLLTLTGDADRGKTPINGLLYEQSIRNALTIPPAGGAILRVTVVGIGACTDVTGATISVPNVVGPDAGPNTGNPVLVYFAGAPAMPDESRTSVMAGVAPSAILYNLPVSNSFSLYNQQITVQHPTCKQAPFPVSDPVAPNLQYTGSVYIQDAADSNKPLAASTMRIFLQ